jgi:phosphoribosylamine--glycine ligase
MIKALVIGDGGRENAIALALFNSGAKIYSYSSIRNPGIARISEKNKIGNLLNLEEIANFAMHERVDFAICGPEAPIVAGVADVLEKYNIPCVSPFKSVAKIEGSKSYARELLKNHDIKAYPKFKIVTTLEEAKNAIAEIKDYVVKPDGLTGGKGVKVLGEHIFNENKAIEYCSNILPQHKKVVIEERMEGEEFVLQCFVDGKRLIPMPLVHDHKRAYDDDKGENTGGMGSISQKDHLLPFITKDVQEKAYKIMKETVEALKKEEGVEYKGILYGQFMITRDGPKIVEYNVRFGDPEAMNVLSLLRSNFLNICLRIIDSNLGWDDADFEKMASVCVYLVPEGYPSNPLKNQPIQIDEKKIIEKGCKLFYASVYEEKGVIYTTGSRSIGIVGISEEIIEASKMCYECIKYVQGRLFYRKDIGTEYLINKRINKLKQLGILK